MIVDFVKIKLELDQRLGNYLDQKIVNKAALVKLIGRSYMREGTDVVFETNTHQQKPFKFNEVIGSLTFTKEEMPGLTYAEIFEKIDKVAVDMAKQIEGDLLVNIKQDLEMEGRVVRSEKPLSGDSILKALEETYVDFDDTRDKPIIPTIVIHPDVFKRFMQEEEKKTVEEKEANKIKMELILDRKFVEYKAREELRKIIDSP